MSDAQLRVLYYRHDDFHRGEGSVTYEPSIEAMPKQLQAHSRYLSAPGSRLARAMIRSIERRASGTARTVTRFVRGNALQSFRDGSMSLRKPSMQPVRRTFKKRSGTNVISSPISEAAPSFECGRQGDGDLRDRPLRPAAGSAGRYAENRRWDSTGVLPSRQRPAFHLVRGAVPNMPKAAMPNSASTRLRYVQTLLEPEIEDLMERCSDYITRGVDAARLRYRCDSSIVIRPAGSVVPPFAAVN